MINGFESSLYLGITTPATLNCITYMCNQNPTHYNIIISNVLPNVKALDAIADRSLYVWGPEESHFLDDISEIEKIIKHFYDSFFKQNHIDLNAIDHVYTASDVCNDFAIYLSIIGKQYSYIESVPNQLRNQRIEIYDIHANKKNPHGSSAYFMCAKKYLAFCGNSELVEKKIIYPESNKQLYKKTKHIEVFDFYSSFLKLNPYQKVSIVASYDIYNIKWDLLRNPSVLLLTQRQWLFPKTEYETVLMYQYLIDYMKPFKEQLIIKPHPSDKIDYSKYFSNAIILPPQFPSNLLPFIDDCHITKVVTISSTSAAWLNTITDTLIECGNLFFSHWKYFIKYRLMTAIIQKLGIYKPTCHVSGIDQYIQLFKMLDTLNPEGELSKMKFIDTNDARQSDVIICNTIKEFNAINYIDEFQGMAIILNLLNEPVQLAKDKTMGYYEQLTLNKTTNDPKADKKIDTLSESVIVYSKYYDIVELTNGYTWNLPNVGITVSVNYSSNNN